MGYFDDYRFRCSALGKIMSSKGDITISNATYLTDLFVGEMYDVTKDLTTKYFEKGTLCEEDGITMLNKLYPGKLLIKNKERKSNDYIHGEMDCMPPDRRVTDIKNAFDLFTFGKASLSNDYFWQLTGYYWLWETDKARLFYCLSNTPEHMLIDEERRLFYQGKYVSTESTQYISACNDLRRKHIYDDMPLEQRFKFWDMDRNEEDIEKAKVKIVKCRKFLNDLYDDHIERIETNKKMLISNL